MTALSGSQNFPPVLPGPVAPRRTAACSQPCIRQACPMRGESADRRQPEAGARGARGAATWGQPAPRPACSRTHNMEAAVSTRDGGDQGAAGCREDATSMDAYLRKPGLYGKMVSKDGSCLFLAVAEQVTGQGGPVR